MRAYTQPGFTAWTSSGPSPHFSIVPGRKFSTTTSAVAHSSSARRWQSSVRRLSATERLPRAITDHQSEWPLCLCWPHSRSASPFGGASTLMTSAPKSASSVPTNGPAMSWPNSTTRRPWSGPSASPSRSSGALVPFVATSSPPDPFAVRSDRSLPRGERAPTRGDRRADRGGGDLRRAPRDERREHDRSGRAGGAEGGAREHEPPRAPQLLHPAGDARIRGLEAQPVSPLHRRGDLAQAAGQGDEIGRRRAGRHAIAGAARRAPRELGGERE